jgi:hypothetical protein
MEIHIRLIRYSLSDLAKAILDGLFLSGHGSLFHRIDPEYFRDFRPYVVVLTDGVFRLLFLLAAVL